MDGMADIVIYPSRFKLFLIAGGSLAFVILGIFLTIQQQIVMNPLELMLASYVGVPFFGLCFMYATYRVLVQQPAVIISREGLFDNASAVGAGMLRWEEIKEIYVHEYLGQRMLGIVPKDAAAVIARQPSIKRIMAKINNGLGGSPFNIAQVSLPISVDELLQKIEEHRAIYRRNRTALAADAVEY